MLEKMNEINEVISQLEITFTGGFAITAILIILTFLVISVFTISKDIYNFISKKFKKTVKEQN